MDYLICVGLGFFSGVCATIGIAIYVGKVQINKRNQRATNWQKVKKSLDKEIKDEYGI